MGQRRSSAPASRSSTASSSGRPTPRCRWSCAARSGGYRTYCHLGTGNYHPVTARIYTDLSFFTADPRVGRDVADIFNYITGYIEPRGLELIDACRRSTCATSSCALIDARDRQCPRRPAGGDLGEDELAGRSGDHRQALRGERRPGSTIDLVIRGICCLRPGRARACPRISASSRSSAASSSTAGSGASAMATRCPTARRKVYISLGRLDAAQFRPARRICAADRERDRPRPDPRPGDGRQHDRQRAELAAQCRRQLHAPRAAAGREAVQPPPLFHDQSVAVGARRRAARRAARRRGSSPSRAAATRAAGCSPSSRSRSSTSAPTRSASSSIRARPGSRRSSSTRR